MATYQVGPARTYTTIQAAINAAAADLDPYIPIDAGTYNEVLDLKKASGGRVVPVYLYAADPNNKPVVSGAGLSAGQALLANSAIATGATERPRFVNLIFDGWDLTRVSYCFYTAGTGPSIRVYYCTFRSGDAPVFQNLRGPSGPDRSILYGCRFVDTGQPIHAENGTYGLVARCYFKPNPNTLCVHNDRSGWYIYNNSAYVNNNGAYGVFRGQDIIGNVIHAHTNNPWFAYNCTGTYDYNRLYGTVSSNTGTNGGHNTSGADPLFVSPSTGNLDIQVGSPCIDASTTLTDAAIDIYGVTAPSGAAYDQGAHELVATTTVTSITVLGPTSIRLNLAASMASDSSWATAGNFTITPGSGAAVTVTAAAASGNPGSSITLTTSEHTNADTYNVAWSGLTNITSGNSNYTGQGTAPTISAVSMTSPTNVSVTFSEPMLNESQLTTPGNYTFAGNGSSFHPTLVTRVDSTHVTLSLGQGCGGATDTLTVSGPRDLAQNVCSDSESFTVYQTSVSSAVASTTWTGYKIRLTLADATYRDASWAGATVTVSGPTSVTPVYVTPSSSTSYIDYTVGEMLQGGSYTVSWSGLVGVADGSIGFTGVGVSPTVSSITAPSSTQVQITWAEAMKDETALVAAGNYVFTPSLNVVSVARTSSTVVTLTTAAQVPGQPYDLAINGPRDLALNVAALSLSDAVSGYPTTVTSVTASANRLRVAFAASVGVPDALLDPTNYAVNRVAPLKDASVDVTVLAVTASGNPAAYVDLTTSDQSLTQAYELVWAGIGSAVDGDLPFSGVAVHQHVSVTGPIPQGKWGGVSYGS